MPARDTAPDPLSLSLHLLILHWHEEQGRLHALTAPREVLCIHLGRNLGEATKDSTTVECEMGCVHVPVFQGPGMQMVWHIYDLRAAVKHQGKNTTNGHFQALLIGEDTFLADDDQAPVLNKGRVGRHLT